MTESRKTRMLLQVTWPMALVSGVLLTVAVIAAWYVHRLQNDASDVLVVNVGSVRAAEEIEIGLREIQACLNKYLRTGDQRQLEAVAEIRRETDRWMDEADRLSTTPREDELVALAKRGYERFFTEFERQSRDSSDPQTRERVEQLLDEVLTREILAPVQEYLDYNEQAMATTSRENQVVADRMALVLLLLGFSGAVAGVLAGFALSRGLRRSLVQLSVPIRDAAGRLSEVAGPLSVTGSASLDDMQVELRHIADHVAGVVTRLQASQREVLRAEQLAAVGQLAAGMAHELRNPLMSLKLLVQAAMERFQNDSLRARDLTILEEVAARLEQSLQTFLDFARPPQIERRVFDLSKLVTQTLDLVAGQAKQRGVRLEGAMTSPWHLDADEGQVRQVLVNLLLNAIDATPPGGRVWLESERAASRPSAAGDSDTTTNSVGCDSGSLLRICDTGGGLPVDFGERIFEPFVSTKDTGVGLGLSICRRIVESHGGEIVAENRSSGGAAFAIWLPDVAEQSNQAELRGPRILESPRQESVALQTT